MTVAESLEYHLDDNSVNRPLLALLDLYEGYIYLQNDSKLGPGVKRFACNRGGRTAKRKVSDNRLSVDDLEQRIQQKYGITHECLNSVVKCMISDPTVRTRVVDEGGPVPTPRHRQMRLANMVITCLNERHSPIVSIRECSTAQPRSQLQPEPASSLITECNELRKEIRAFRMELQKRNSSQSQTRSHHMSTTAMIRALIMVVITVLFYTIPLAPPAEMTIAKIGMVGPPSCTQFHGIYSSTNTCG